LRTVDDLTERLRDAANALERMRGQQLKIVDGAIAHENIVCKALEAHAQIVTDAAQHEEELRKAREERAIIVDLLSKQEASFKAAMAKRKEVSSIVGMQGKTLIETKVARETILACVQEMSITMNGALQNIMGGIEIGKSMSYSGDDEDSISPIEKEAQAMEDGSVEEEDEMVMIAENKFAEEGPEISIVAHPPSKKLEDIMNEISAASSVLLTTDMFLQETRSDEVITTRASDCDRIMESRGM
jgi:predicted nucleic acid-binding OB-fold protein